MIIIEGVTDRWQREKTLFMPSNPKEQQKTGIITIIIIIIVIMIIIQCPIMIIIIQSILLPLISRLFQALPRMSCLITMDHLDGWISYIPK